MTVKLLLLIVSLALLTAAGRAQDNYRPKQRDLSWGVETKGVRMAAWTNPATDKIFVAVRNFSRKKICYCNPEEIGFSVYARKNDGSAWQILRNKTWADEMIVLPLCGLINLKPTEETPFYVLENNTRKKTNYTHSLDLREYAFPADWSGTVEVKIEQSLVFCVTGNPEKPKKPYVGIVESPAVKIKLPFTETTAQR